MKSRIIWAAVVLAAMAGFYFMTIRPAMNPAPRKIKFPNMAEFRPPEVAPPPLPPLVIETPTLAPPPLPVQSMQPRVIGRPTDPSPAQLEVPIQNGATIDFSYGAPMVRSQGKDQEAMDRALKEMAEATKQTTFPVKK